MAVSDSKTNLKERESVPEIFRIILMGMIVFWHLVLYGAPSYLQKNSLLILTTLTHVAVPCFVFMSGWYGIRPSIKGFTRLVIMVIFYSLAGLLFRLGVYHESFSMHCVLSALLPLFHGRWWFIEVYLALYLTVPLLESFILQSSTRRVCIMIGFLWFISFWLGQTSAHIGLLPLFYMLYLMGRTLNGSSLSKMGIFLGWCFCVAITIIAGWICSFVGAKWLLYYRMVFFNYTAPWLIISSVLLSLTVLRIQYNGRCVFRSKIVNSMAAAVFPCYLMHERNFIVKSVYDRFGCLCEGELAVILWGSIAALLILVACFCIDLICRPFYSFVARNIAIGISNIAKKI